MDSKSQIVRIFRTAVASSLFCLWSSSKSTDGHCCLHPGHLNSYSSHWSHHDVGPLPELVARVHSCCRVKAGNSHPLICFPSLSRFEELSHVHLELRKCWSFHHSIVLVHDVFPQGLVNSFSCHILCMFISSCVKISSRLSFIFAQDFLSTDVACDSVTGSCLSATSLLPTGVAHKTLLSFTVECASCSRHTV